MNVFGLSRERTLARLLLFTLLFVVVAVPIGAKTLLSREEALSLYFPDADWKRNTVYLTRIEQERVEALSETDMKRAVIHTYQALDGTSLLGIAYLDQHRVRTLPETILVLVTPDGVVADVQVIEFREPMEYLPGRAWYKQLIDRSLDKELYLKRGIDGITGATLTARATTQATRRVLAIHQVVNERADP